MIKTVVFSVIKGEKIFQRFESCVRSSLLFGMSISGLEFALGVIREWLQFLWQWVKKHQGNRAQSLCPEMKVHCADKVTAFNDFFLGPLYPFSKEKKKSILELFETKFIFFYSVLCLYPVPFLWHSFKTFLVVDISSPLMCYVYSVDWKQRDTVRKMCSKFLYISHRSNK